MKLKKSLNLIAILIVSLFLLTIHVFAEELLNNEEVEQENNTQTQEKLINTDIEIDTETLETHFSDVDDGDKFFVEINALAEMGLINGYEDGTFRPYQEVNRAEALKMLLLASRAINEENIDEYMDESSFSDVERGLWYSPYINFAAEKGIVQGYLDGEFKASEKITLVTALKILLESYDDLDYPTEFKNHFADVDENAWYAKYLRYADEHDMIEIYPSNSIYPDAVLNRGDIAWIIYRKLMSEKGNMEFGKATFYGKAVQGHYTASGKIFDLNQFTAAHKELPFGTIVEVTNLANGEKTQVEITDRGPYGPGRIIDLTEAAFDDIAWMGTGVIHVQTEVIYNPEWEKEEESIEEIEVPGLFE